MLDYLPPRKCTTWWLLQYFLMRGSPQQGESFRTIPRVNRYFHDTLIFFDQLNLIFLFEFFSSEWLVFALSQCDSTLGATPLDSMKTY